MSFTSRLGGAALTQCGYLSQIASMPDAAEIVTDGPLKSVRADRLIWEADPTEVKP